MQIINYFYYKNKNLEIKSSKDNIKSHDTMPTFFSGTDTSTLQDEGAARHNFVSLIVNNEGTYTAAITRQVIREVSYSDSYTFFGESVFSEEVKQDTLKFIEYSMLDIEKEEVDNPFQDLENRFNTIAEIKSKTSTIFDSQLSLFKTSPNPYYDYTKASEQDPVSVKPQNIVEETPSKELTDSEIIDNIYKQIITGSIFAGVSNIDTTKIIPKLDSMYTKRFSSIAEMEDWISNYIEFLLNEAMITDIINSDDSIYNIQSIYAQQLFDLISLLPESTFKNQVLDCLISYIN